MSQASIRFKTSFSIVLAFSRAAGRSFSSVSRLNIFPASFFIALSFYEQGIGMIMQSKEHKHFKMLK